MLSFNQRYLLWLGCLVILILVHGVDSRRGGSYGRYSSRSSRYSGSRSSGSSSSGSSSLGTTGKIILGSVLGGVALLAIILLILYKVGAFKNCCKKTTSSDKSALMYSPSPASDGKKIHRVTRVDNYAGKTDYYTPTYYASNDPVYPPPPPPVYKY